MTERRRTSPSPLPAHPTQAELIAQQEQPERISPPRIKFKSSPFFEVQANTLNGPLINASPVSNLNVGKDEKRLDDKRQPKKEREELIEATYLKRILSKETNQAGGNVNDVAKQASNEVPICCYAPPCINYVNGCKEIRKSLNYGKRVQIVDHTPCNHYLIGNETCERCCKLITLNRNIFSLHCAWHHQLLTCAVCKVTLSDLEHRVYRGKIFCDECFKRAKHLHGCELQTFHRKKS